MISSPCSCTLKWVKPGNEYSQIFVRTDEECILQTPMPGLLNYIEKGWKTVARISSDNGCITIIRQHGREYLGVAKKIPIFVKKNESIGMSVSRNELLEIRVSGDILVMLFPSTKKAYKGELIGIFGKNKN